MYRALIASVLIATSSLACQDRAPVRVVTVFAAASMGPALDLLEPRFEAEHPGADLRVELSGSQLACAKISDQGREADLVLSADYELIDRALVPRFAGFNLLFGNNALVLAYDPQSPIARELQSGEPWQRLLARPGVRVGVANPALAPVGYRAMLALQLNDRLAPEPLRLGAAIAARIDREHMRPDVTKLLAPLQAGELDAAFVYASEAKQHGLPFVQLDPRIDFSAVEHQAIYAGAAYEIPAEGGGESRVVRGSAAVYGLTIPKSAPHRDLAVELVSLLLSEDGRALAARAHMDLYTAAERTVHGALPADLLEVARRRE